MTQMSLSAAPMRMELEVVSLDGMNERRLALLSSFGLVPGSTVALVQRKPAPVIRVGETEFAVDRDILRSILVARRRR